MRGNRQPVKRIVPLFLAAFVVLSACAGTSPHDAALVPRSAAGDAAAAAAAPASMASGTVPPLATPGLIASPTDRSLQSLETGYPLALGDTWVFRSTRYQGYPAGRAMTATLVITETVADVHDASPYFIARVRRDSSTETPVVAPVGGQSELRPAGSTDYWLVLNENRVLYRQEGKLDLPKLGEALVKFEFPLKVGDRWPLTENQAKLSPSGREPGMTRQVVSEASVDVPAGHFTGCFSLHEEWAGFTLDDWYCPNVGIVESTGAHVGAPEVWHQALIRYELK